MKVMNAQILAEELIKLAEDIMVEDPEFKDTEVWEEFQGKDPDWTVEQHELFSKAMKFLGRLAKSGVKTEDIILKIELSLP